MTTGKLSDLSRHYPLAPVIERHRWAMTIATRHGWGRLDFMDFIRTGRVNRRLPQHLVDLVGRESSPALRAELAWLLAYTLERPVGARLPGWGAMRVMGPYLQAPSWWLWPGDLLCVYCGAQPAPGEVTCEQHAALQVQLHG